MILRLIWEAFNLRYFFESVTSNFCQQNDEHNSDRESVAKIFSVMPKILHVISSLLNFLDLHGATLRGSVGDPVNQSIRLPVYRALSLTGGSVMVSSRPSTTAITTANGVGTITTTAAPKKITTISATTTPEVKQAVSNSRVPVISSKNSSERFPFTSPAPTSSSVVSGVTRRIVTSIRGGTGTVTERTYLTPMNATASRVQPRISLSMPKRYGRDRHEAIQREIEEFNKQFQ